MLKEKENRMINEWNKRRIKKTDDDAINHIQYMCPEDIIHLLRN